MKIGPKCEISTIIDVLPEHIEVGAESFLADGIYLGGPLLHRGIVTTRKTRLSGGTFIGNHAVIPAGQSLPANILIGISTVADESQIESGQSWFGHPSFEIPRREIVECDRKLTHEPGLLRYARRFAWEAARFALPVVPMLLAILWFVTVSLFSSVTAVGFWFLVMPLIGIGIGITLTTTVLLLKWSLIGRVKPGHHALWSSWCSRWDFVYVAWSKLASRVLSSFEGTPLLPWYLRAMGVGIGKNVILGRGFAQVVDPDMLHFEDGATVNGMFQAHSFEDRVLKIDRVRVRKRATLKSASV